MPLEPGNLSDLSGPGKEAWDKLVVNYVNRYINEYKTNHFQLLASPNWDPTDIAVVDWDAHPLIVKNCLGDARSMKFLDWNTNAGNQGRLWQDEYFEWRTIRDQDGKLVRFEGTTEFLEYWGVLAAHHPATALDVIGRFAGETTANWREVYGSYNPFAPTADAAGRQSAFLRMMTSQNGAVPKSPYNNGLKAITFLSLPVSSMNAAVALFVSAAKPYAKIDANGKPAPMTKKELLASASVAAIDCRNSDPAMVAIQNELALSGKAMAFNDPVGVYIRGLKHEQLLTPDGQPVPSEWIRFQRGSRGSTGDGLERSQRVIFEVPSGIGYSLGDLVREDTEEALQYGYQIAELIKLAIYMNTSVKDTIVEAPIVLDVQPTTNCGSTAQCAQLAQLYAEFEKSTSLTATQELDAVIGSHFRKQV